MKIRLLKAALFLTLIAFTANSCAHGRHDRKEERREHRQTNRH